MTTTYTEKILKSKPGRTDSNWHDEYYRNETIESALHYQYLNKGFVVSGGHISSIGVDEISVSDVVVKQNGRLFSFASVNFTFHPSTDPFPPNYPRLKEDELATTRTYYIYVIPEMPFPPVSQTYLQEGINCQEDLQLNFILLGTVDVDDTGILFVNELRNQEQPNSNITPALARATGLTASAVKVIVYDTKNDSDGGAWRFRCKSTSWYNEPLNQANRGSKREFPEIALIVIHAAKLTIYDLTEPDLPMWMVFHGWTQNSIYLGVGDSLSSAAMKNGLLVVGTNVAVGALSLINFIKDETYIMTTATTKYWVRNVAGRNVESTIQISNYFSAGIVNRLVNDVAMTILGNSPIDVATGLPIPTIAVATDGGISVIDGFAGVGTVVDSYVTAKIYSVSFYGDYLIAGRTNSTTPIVIYVSKDIAADGFLQDRSFGKSLAPYLPGRYFNGIAAGKGILAFEEKESSEIGGLILAKENPNSPTNGMVAHITNSYNTGWMHGDIKGAFIANTEEGQIVDKYALTVTLNTPTPASGQNFGYSSSITDNGLKLVVGCLGGDDVFTYDWDNVNQTWVRDTSSDLINVSPTTSGVAISGNGLVLVIGNRTTNGVIKIYDWDTDHWTQRGSDLAADTPQVDENLGSGVSLSYDGSILAATAFQYDSAEYENVGRVIVWDWNGSAWVERGFFVPVNITSRTAWGVALTADGSRLAVCCYGDSGGGFNNCGSTLIYDWNGSDWDLIQTIYGTSNNARVIDCDLSEDGTYLIQSAYTARFVRIFKWNGFEYELIHTINGVEASGETTDYFGISSAMANGPHKIFVGASNDVGTYNAEGIGYTFTLYDEDRSINANHLQVVGELTKSPVAEGAELVAYSGFSVNDFLVQVDNPDLDYGTGDFHVMFWAFDSALSAAVARVLFDKSTDLVNGITVYFDGASNMVFRGGGSGTQSFSSFGKDRFGFVVIKRVSGVVYVFFDAKLKISFAAASTVTNAGLLMIGINNGATKYSLYPNDKICMVRTGASAPSDDQIKYMYETEKKFFKNGAKACLYGYSSSIKDLCYNNKNDILSILTIAGITKIKDLSPVRYDRGFGKDYLETEDVAISISANSSRITNNVFKVKTVSGSRSYVTFNFFPKDPIEIAIINRGIEPIYLTWTNNETGESDTEIESKEIVSRLINTPTTSQLDSVVSIVAPDVVGNAEAFFEIEIRQPIKDDPIYDDFTKIASYGNYNIVCAGSNPVEAIVISPEFNMIEERQLLQTQINRLLETEQEFVFDTLQYCTIPAGFYPTRVFNSAGALRAKSGWTVKYDGFNYIVDCSGVGTWYIYAKRIV